MRNPTIRQWLAGGLLLWCCSALFAGYLTAADWVNWRGPFQNGVSPDTNLPATWSDDPKAPVNFLWKMPYGCRSTPIVCNGRVFIDNSAGEGFKEQERVMCLDAKTGKVIWERRFNIFHADIASSRLGWTHLVADAATGNVYWHGTQGNLVGFDKDGKILWQRQLMEMDGRVSGYGGRLPSPALAGDLLVIGMINSGWADQGKGGNRFLAVNKFDGTPVWWSQTSERPGTYFSTPVTATINGQNLLISGCSDGGIHAVQAGTGKHMWSYLFCKGAINCSPAVDGTLVYANHGEESPGTNVQGRIVCVDAAALTDGHPKLVWDVGGVQAKYTSPLVNAGRVYIADDAAKLWCFDAKTGKKIWHFTYGRNAMGSPVWGDGKIFIAEKNARFHILEPGAKKCEPLDEHFFPEASGADVEIYGNAAIADGRIFFPTRDELYCIGTKDGKSGQVPATATPVKAGKRAQLLIYPCEVVAHAGDAVPLKLKVYDENGNFIEEVSKVAEAKWTLPQPPLPPGAKNQPPALQASFDLGGTAKLVLNKAPITQQGFVEAEWNGLKARARVRVAPRLPYTEDFEKTPVGGVPPGWINCQGKFLVKKLADGNNVLAKVTSSSNAVIARGSCFFGTPEMTNYTIEADVQGQKIDQWMPDAGVGACRYLLKLEGQTQTLRLQSWDAIPRVDEWVPFKWQPGIWYHMKLTAIVDKDRATLRAKVWPRGQQEPPKWDIDFTDPSPNLEGAPFLYGYVLGHTVNAPGTEVYFDNLQVSPNK